MLETRVSNMSAYISLLGAVLAVTLAALRADGSESRLSEVVEKVRSNEVLYGNIEFVIKKTLEADLTAAKRPPDAIQSSTGTMRYVSQGDLFYFRNDEDRDHASETRRDSGLPLP